MRQCTSVRIHLWACVFACVSEAHEKAQCPCEAKSLLSQAAEANCIHEAFLLQQFKNIYHLTAEFKTTAAISGQTTVLRGGNGRREAAQCASLSPSSRLLHLLFHPVFFLFSSICRLRRVGGGGEVGAEVVVVVGRYFHVFSRCSRYMLDRWWQQPNQRHTGFIYGTVHQLVLEEDEGFVSASALPLPPPPPPLPLAPSFS